MGWRRDWKTKPATPAQRQYHDERAEQMLWLKRRGWFPADGGWHHPTQKNRIYGRLEWALAEQISHERRLAYIRRNP